MVLIFITIVFKMPQALLTSYTYKKSLYDQLQFRRRIIKKDDKSRNCCIMRHAHLLEHALFKAVER